MSEQSATIESVSLIADNTTEVIFNLAGNFSFTAGQYITVTLPNLSSLPVKEQIHDFSIASAPEEAPRVTIAFRNSESNFKRELLQSGQAAKVLIDGPKGNFTLPTDQTAPIVFIAGGIGITPFLSMIRHIVRAKLGIHPTLMYYNHDRGSAAYLGELEQYAAAIDLVAVFGELTQHEIGSYLTARKEPALWYLAGPRGLVKLARELLAAARVDDRNIKSEEFAGYEK